MKEDALSFLGLINRGGYTLVGEPLINKLSKVHLLLVATDSKREAEFKEKAARRHIPCLTICSKEELGQALGFEELTAVGITSKKAADALINKISK